MQRTDFAGDAQQQWHSFQGQQLDQEAAEREQRAADDQTFEETLMRRIETRDVASGRNQREEQPFLQIAKQPAERDGNAQHQRLPQGIVNFGVVDDSTPHHFAKSSNGVMVRSRRG